MNNGIFTPPLITLRVDQVLRIQGYKDLSKVHPGIRAIAESSTALAEKTFKPVVYFRRVPVKDISGEALTLETETVFRSKAFEKYLPECHEVAVFVMTLGGALDEIGREMAEAEKMVEAVFLETAGWLGIEQLTKLFSTFMRGELAPEGFRLGRRMSPGYTFRVGNTLCDWRLEDQRPIFELFDKKNMSVEMLDSCAMFPKMSRSGLYGIVRKKEPTNFLHGKTE